jgi:hypothetical protein
LLLQREEFFYFYMENYESDIFMSQEGDASIDFTLLDRPNCK